MIKEKPAWLKRFIDRLEAIRKNPAFSKGLRVVSIIYPLVLLYLSRNEILELDWKSFSLLFLFSFLIFYVSMSLQNVNWSLIVDGNLRQFWLNSKIYFQTILMKRLPGGVWHWLGRVNLYENIQKDEQNSVSSANFIEWLILILTGFAVYLSTVNLLLGIFAAIACIGVCSWLITRQFGFKSKSVLLSMTVILLYILCWLTGAAILHWLIRGVDPQTQLRFMDSLAAWSLSSAISMLVFFFPSGALLRDFSLGALLLNKIEPAKLVLLILQVRIIFLAADFIWSFISLRFVNFILKPRQS